MITDYLRPLPLFRALACAMILAYSFALGVLIAAVRGVP